VDDHWFLRSGVSHTTEVHEQNAELVIPVHVEDGALYTSRGLSLRNPSFWPTQCVCSFNARKQGISFNKTDQLFFALARQCFCCAAGAGLLYKVNKKFLFTRRLQYKTQAKIF
jgi:hypothetical protein